MPALGQAAGNGLEAFGLSLITIAAAMYEQTRVQVESMVARVLVGRAELFQTRAVTGWEDGEEDGRPGRRSPTLNSHHVAFDGDTDQPR